MAVVPRGTSLGTRRNIWPMANASSGPRKSCQGTSMKWLVGSDQRKAESATCLRGPEDALAIGQMFLRVPRDVPRGTTATGSALLFAQSLLDNAPRALRHVIDISTDGECNEGPKVESVRDAVVARGTVINGLAITTDSADLDDYMAKSVIGGDQSFVLKANDFEAYGHTLRIKLFREITAVDMI